MPTNRTEPHGREPSAALLLSLDHVRPRAWGGWMSSRVHIRLAASIARAIRCALRRSGSYLPRSGSDVSHAIELRGATPRPDCESVAERVSSCVGIGVFLALAIWGPAVLL